MTYDDCLKTIKKQNPGINEKKATEKAKVMYANFEKAAQAMSDGDVTYATRPESYSSIPSGKKISIQELSRVEKLIRENVTDVNRIVSMSRDIMPEGKLKFHGKEDVNTKVTFEDDYGNRIPVMGYFRIFF